MEAPAWFASSLKDVRSGNSFTINDFKGKVVLVETMAVWCTTCYQQQTQIKALHESLGMRDDFVSVSLDIDPNEDESTLTKYTQKTAASTGVTRLPVPTSPARSERRMAINS